ncbi:MAG: cytochrome c [Candidatus Tectomicrobia bacterium]|uniref:Cytochrome c n=1 Tax=Tectimicrobiota bacterium TaxID=2528274 RepID=A0A932MNI1_UNCTE|nr:cytochrome c [Candidatus Tectomicrobia bacterium]
MKSLRAGFTLAALVAAVGLLAGCTKDFSFAELIGYENPQVKARKDLMQSHPRNIRAIQAAMKENRLADAAKSADALSQSARRIPDAFKERVLEGQTTALPVIWENKADFDQKARNLGTAAASLAVVLRAGDRNGAEAALKNVQGTCGGCHRTYRKPPPKK